MELLFSSKKGKFRLAGLKKQKQGPELIKYQPINQMTAATDSIQPIKLNLWPLSSKESDCLFLEIKIKSGSKIYPILNVKTNKLNKLDIALKKRRKMMLNLELHTPKA